MGQLRLALWIRRRAYNEVTSEDVDILTPEIRGKYSETWSQMQTAARILLGVVAERIRAPNRGCAYRNMAQAFWMRL